MLEPMCPKCSETRQIDVMQAGWHFCNVCACPFRWPRPAEEQLPGGPASDAAVTGLLSRSCQETQGRRD